MNFIDLNKQYLKIKKNINMRIQKVLNHGQFIMGPEVAELEVELSNYLNMRNTVCCSSGTDALVVSLMALGIGPGDYVITTPFSFIATAEAILLVGAKVLFADIDPETFNIDVEKVKFLIENYIFNYKAIISVDLFGQQADNYNLKKLCEYYNLFLIEDAAQSFGSTFADNHIGYYSDIATTSFFPSKPLGCYGDGGAIFTNDDDLDKKIRSIIEHGKEGYKYYNVRLGLNGRMDTIQAAILLEKLKIFDDEINRRNKIADMYNERLKDIVIIPKIKPYFRSVWAQYSILTFNRYNLYNHLRICNIPTNVYYPTPLHKQPIFKNNGQGLPISEKVCNEILSLPMHPYLSEEEIENICNEISKSF